MDLEEILIESGGINVRPRINIFRELDGKYYRDVLSFFATGGSIGYFPSVTKFCSKFTISHVVDWTLEKLVSCRSSHQLCKSSWQSTHLAILPTRVLDISTVNDGDLDAIRLWETKDSKGRYIALSHCWGGLEIPVKKTTRSTVKERIENGFMVSELPLLFQQAVIIARRLGIFRLWIDSLCIIPDDAHDWEVEAARIADVYSGSFLMLAAARANNSAEGILGERNVVKADRSQQSMEYYHIETHNVATIVAYYDLSEGAHYDLAGIRHIESEEQLETVSPLMKRAWVLQERVVSPRTLFLQCSKLFLECDIAISCECGVRSNELQPIQRTTVVNEAEVRERWCALVFLYSRLRLSKPSDKLPAFSAIASAFQDCFKGSYLAGIWKTENLDDFASQMGWSLSDAMWPGTYHSQPYRAPTWSWASLDCDENATEFMKIFIDGHDDFTAAEGLHILSAECEVPRANPYGEVTEGFVELREKTIEGKLTHRFDDQSKKTWYLDLSDKDTSWRTFSPDVPLLLDGNTFMAVHMLLITETKISSAGLRLLF